MKRKRDEDQFSALRHRAEAVLRATSESRASAEALDNLSSGEINRLVHEMSVYQVELEMQNEELRSTEEALNASRDRYVELYDFAPVGYFTLDDNGGILEANLTGAQLLGVERRALLGQPLARFVAAEDRDHFHVYYRQLSHADGRPDAEVRMRGREGVPFYAQLHGAVVREGDEPLGRYRLALSDTTERRRAQDALRQAHDELEAQVKARTAELAEANAALRAEALERQHKDGGGERAAAIGSSRRRLGHVRVRLADRSDFRRCALPGDDRVRAG